MTSPLANTRFAWRNVIKQALFIFSLVGMLVLSACNLSNSKDSDKTTPESNTPYFVSSPIAGKDVGSNSRSSGVSENVRSFEGPTLNNTVWQLVKIESMDDSVYTPRENEKYTIEFLPQGNFSGQADCNRMRGQWLSLSKQQLLLDKIIATHAMCSPDSLHDRFLSHLNHIRSYVLRDGQLFLATKADGAILKFELLKNNQARPAFNCNKSSGTVEQHICQSESLAKLDLFIDQLFVSAKQTINQEAIKALAATQRGWIKGRNDCWKQDNLDQCILQAYQQRISELQVQTGFVVVPAATVFQCDNGTNLDIYFYNNTQLPLAVANWQTANGAAQAMLFLAKSASGALYEGRNLRLRSKGDQATWETLDESSKCSLSQ